MLNKQKGIMQTIKKPFNKALATTALLLALNGWDPSFAQTPQNNSNKVTTTVNINTNDALSFAVNNVDKYYPDMKWHLDSLVDHFRDQEQKDTVNFLFQTCVLKNITDPKKQVASIIYCIEHFVFKWDKKLKKTFSEKYDIGTVIDDDEYEYLINFNKWYNKRFKWYYKKLNNILDEQNKTIERINKQIEGIINTFTVNDVKNNANIKELVLKTEQVYIKFGDEIFPHLAELIQAAKQ